MPSLLQTLTEFGPLCLLLVHLVSYFSSPGWWKWLRVATSPFFTEYQYQWNFVGKRHDFNLLSEVGSTGKYIQQVTENYWNAWEIHRQALTELVFNPACTPQQQLSLLFSLTFHTALSELPVWCWLCKLWDANFWARNALG